MLGTNNKIGFSLIELMIAIAIIAFMASVAIPVFRPGSPRYEREKFIAELNALMASGWQQALMHHMLHRIHVDFSTRNMKLEVLIGEIDAREQKFEAVKQAYQTQIIWPEHLHIKQFFIEAVDEFARYVSAKTSELWFFIVPDGLCQEVIINFVDVKDTLFNGKPRPGSLVLNPFSAQFKEYDTFQKP